MAISFTDAGVGIPPERLPEMFELFVQGDRSLARSEGGLGIGLTVVKNLVELHGGSVSARSEGVGRGSEFTVRVPAAPTRPAAVVSSPGTATKHRNSRVLVVDDNVDTVNGLSKILTILGHDVSIASNGPAAIEVARRVRPQYVLLDIGLPGMDGYEVARHLRQEDACAGSIIIAITGYGQDEDRRLAKASGFDHHLIKPLDHDALILLLSQD